MVDDVGRRVRRLVRRQAALPAAAAAKVAAAASSTAAVGTATGAAAAPGKVAAAGKKAAVGAGPGAAAAAGKDAAAERKAKAGEGTAGEQGDAEKKKAERAAKNAAKNVRLHRVFCIAVPFSFRQGNSGVVARQAHRCFWQLAASTEIYITASRTARIIMQLVAAYSSAIDDEVPALHASD